MKDEVVRRDYLRMLKNYKDIDLIKVITGMRRTGKSTLMRQFRSLLVQEGVPEDNIIYIDMDSLQNSRFRDGGLVYGDVISRKGKGRQYILIDEVQNIDGWVRVVESLRNDVDCDIYITGSNAYMLSSEISTLLTGRSVTVTVMPLSLREACELGGETDPKAAFVRYLRHGGLPVLRPEHSEETAFRILDGLKSDIILKDICNRKPGTDPVKMRKVINYLYSEIGNPVSVTKISKSLGISASTAGEYLQLITDSMLFIKAERYDLRGHNVLKQEPKYYCADTGMRYSQPISSERDFGKTLENIVFLELLRRGCRTYVGRAGTDDGLHLEVDFIVLRGNETDYYQVTQSLTDPAVNERELRPLRAAKGRGEKYILTYDDGPVFKGRDAVIMNIVDFLMEEGPEEGPYLEDSSSRTLLSMLDDYVGSCARVSETVVTRDNFDELSTEFQSRFFDLQAFIRRPRTAEDAFLQSALDRMRANNVRIFDAMVACVNANKEPKYKPAMTVQMDDLRRISEDIRRHLFPSPPRIERRPFLRMSRTQKP